MKAKTKEIELFGRSFILSERYAQDILNLTEYIKELDNSLQSQLFYAAKVGSDALKNNIKTVKFYKRHKIRKLISVPYLLETLSIHQLDELAAAVYELEGIDLKKKINPEAPGQAGKPQTPSSPMPPD
jgi:hypothetical protein